MGKAMHLYRVEHDDETYIYCATSQINARQEHWKLIVAPSIGHEPAASAMPDPNQFKIIPDDEVITFRDEFGFRVTRLARAWCDELGLLCTTAGL